MAIGGGNMLSVGQTAPDFTLTGTNREQYSISDFRGQKVVLAFYPAAFTGTCTKEMCTFSDSIGPLQDANAVVFGVSVDSPFSNKAFAEKYDIRCELLSDVHRTMIADYGMEFENFVIEGYTAANRGVVIVDEDGKIGYFWLAENLGLEPNYEEILQYCNS